MTAKEVAKEFLDWTRTNRNDPNWARFVVEVVIPRERKDAIHLEWRDAKTIAKLIEELGRAEAALTQAREALSAIADEYANGGPITESTFGRLGKLAVIALSTKSTIFTSVPPPGPTS